MWSLWLAAAIILLFGFVVFRGAPYVPSKKRELIQAFDELYPLNEDDVLVDIGSGDGIVLRAAAAQGARAIGYELNPLLVGISRLISRKDRLITVYLADFWQVKLPKSTTIVYVFGDSRDIAKMAKKVAQEADRLKKPLYFMSYGFNVPGQSPLRTLGAYYLYKYAPLQIKKP
jgi:hypothetical protein